MDAKQVERWLESSDPSEQVQALAWIEEHEVEPGLFARATLLATSPSAEVRDQLAQTIATRGSLDRTASLTALGILLRDSSELVRADATEVCGSLDARELKPHIIDLLQHDSAMTVRASACEALGRWPDDDSVEALSAALLDDDDVVRTWAAMGLGDTKRPDALAVLRRHSETETSTSVLVAIHLAFLSTGSREAIDELRSLAVRLSLRDLHVLFPRLRQLFESEGPAEWKRDVGSLASYLVDSVDAVLRAGDWARSRG